MISAERELFGSNSGIVAFHIDILTFSKPFGRKESSSFGESGVTKLLFVLMVSIFGQPVVLSATINLSVVVPSPYVCVDLYAQRRLLESIRCYTFVLGLGSVLQMIMIGSRRSTTAEMRNDHPMF